MRGPTEIEAATRASACALAMATMVLVAGCGSTVSDTSVAPPDQHNADDVALDLLDPGKYPITAVPLAIAPSSGTGVVLEGQAVTSDIGVYTPQAALHFQADPIDSAALFAATGVESVSIRDGMVFQAETATAAAHVVDDSLRVKLIPGPP